MAYLTDCWQAFRYACAEFLDAYRNKLQILRWRREPFDIENPTKGQP